MIKSPGEPVPGESIRKEDKKRSEEEGEGMKTKRKIDFINNIRLNKSTRQLTRTRNPKVTQCHNSGLSPALFQRQQFLEIINKLRQMPPHTLPIPQEKTEIKQSETFSSARSKFFHVH